jgi:hypothetical protein
MKTIKIKVEDYNQDDKILLVKACSDETVYSDPEHYAALVYQPFTMWPDETIPENIIKNIARASMYVTECQRTQESISETDDRHEKFKSYVGKTIEFNVEDLLK